MRRADDAERELSIEDQTGDRYNVVDATFMASRPFWLWRNLRWKRERS